VEIDTGEVDGSISLQGARIDDLSLRQYHQTVDPESPEVTLLSPINTQYGHDAFFGWEAQNGDATSALSDARSQWTAAEGSRLTPSTPVTLTFDAGDGRVIVRTISIDEHFMFTITDVVRNTGGAAITVRPFGTVRRDGLPEDYKNLPIVHQGLIGGFGPDNRMKWSKFTDAEKHSRNRVRGRVGEDQRIRDEQCQGGWLGITDHYWLTAIILDQSEPVSAYFDGRQADGNTDFLASYRGQWREIPAGSSSRCS
jgi:YidC/Oxa1 family membrane protein insertase